MLFMYQSDIECFFQQSDIVQECRNLEFFLFIVCFFFVYCLISVM